MHRGTIRTLLLIAIFFAVIIALLLGIYAQSRSDRKNTLYFPDQPPVGTYTIIGHTLGYDSDYNEDLLYFEADPEGDGTYAGYRVFTKRVIITPDAPNPRAQYVIVEDRDSHLYATLHVYLP